MPSALPIRRHACTLLLYKLGSTWRRNLTRSSGVTAVCVVPCGGQIISIQMLLEATHACEDTADCACSIVLSRVQFNAASFGLGLRAGFLVLVDSSIGQLAGLGLSGLSSLSDAPCREDWSLQRVFRGSRFGCWPRK